MQQSCTKSSHDALAPKAEGLADEQAYNAALLVDDSGQEQSFEEVRGRTWLQSRERLQVGQGRSPSLCSRPVVGQQQSGNMPRAKAPADVAHMSDLLQCPAAGCIKVW